MSVRRSAAESSRSAASLRAERVQGSDKNKKASVAESEERIFFTVPETLAFLKSLALLTCGLLICPAS
jgi:hypothetical protein